MGNRVLSISEENDLDNILAVISPLFSNDVFALITRLPSRQKQQRHEIQAEIRLVREKNASIASLNSELHHELREVCVISFFIFLFV